MQKQFISFTEYGYNQEVARLTKHAKEVKNQVMKLVYKIETDQPLGISTADFWDLVRRYAKELNLPGEGVYEVYQGELRPSPAFLAGLAEQYKIYAYTQRQYDEYQILLEITRQLNLLRGSSFYGPSFGNIGQYIERYITKIPPDGFQVTTRLAGGTN